MSLVPEIEAHIDVNAPEVTPDFHLVEDDGRFVAVDNRACIRVVLCTREEAAQVDA